MARGEPIVKRVEANGADAHHKLCSPITEEQEKCSDVSDELKKASLPVKVHIHRNSVLTDLMSLNHLQTVHNIAIAICVLLLINALLYYIAAPDKFLEDASVMGWAVGGLKTFLLIWTGLHVSCLFVLHPVFSYWTRVRARINTKVVDSLFLVMYINFLILMFVIPAHLVTINEIPPITGFAILAEQVRIFMKVYSYVRENAPKAIFRKPGKGEENLQDLCPTMAHFVYFLFSPTLVYRDSYPRTKEVRWGFVVSNFLQFFACIFINYCLFLRFNVDTFGKVGVEKLALRDVPLILAGCMFVGSLYMFLIFYCILHCWLNAFAEMLRFGDRMFYQDWWNSTSFSQYYRKWNAVVHEWLYAYIYSDFYKISGSRSAAMMTVFIISAVVHEYIITFSLGFFHPALCIVYCTVGVPVVFITKQKTAKFWNILMWSLLFSGWGLLVFSYSIEWYSRRNCPRLLDGAMDFFFPRSWSCDIIQG